jgi:heme-degrading monooxygenase HmoA
MIQIAWQYEVKEENRSKFELAYGPGGAWSNLFAWAPGYRGTVLLRDAEDPRKYLTFDVWDTEEDHLDFLNQRREEYAAMRAAFSELVISEASLGVYKLLSEATVRRAPGSARGRTNPRRRSR